MGKQERIIIVEPEEAPMVPPEQPAQEPLFEPVPAEPDLTPAAVE